MQPVCVAKFHSHDFILLNTGRLPYKLSELIKNTVMLWRSNAQKKILRAYKPKNWKVNPKISPHTSEYNIRVKFFISIKLTVFSFFRVTKLTRFYTSFSVFTFRFCSKKKRKERENNGRGRTRSHTFMVFFTIRSVWMRC